MTTQKDLVSEHVKTLIKSLSTENPRKTAFAISAAVELLRRVQELGGQSAHALANFYSKVADVPWEKISFSFTQAVLVRGPEVISQYAKVPLDTDKVYRILLDAVAVFCDILADSPEDATQAVFEAVVAELAEHYADEPVTARPGVSEIFQPRMVARCFKHNPVDERLCAEIGLRPVLYSGHHGVRIRGVAWESALAAGGPIALLESGEFLPVAADRCETLTDYADISSLLLCYLHAITSNDSLGKFTHPVNCIDVDLSPLVHVFDIEREAARIGATGATGPVGASVKFPIPDTDLAVVVDASATTNGPYTIAKLVRGDTVLMRHETPRENTPFGIYLFPLSDRTIILRALKGADIS
ncbi:hypothetical protein EBZ39_00540 [bacterium]|nr:hypothetical protein [bacterium]